MKKIILSVFSILLLNSAFSQKGKQLSDYELAFQVYQKSVSRNDLAAARFAVYELMTLKPEEKNWNDTLLILYFSSGMYGQSIQLGKELLKEKPDHQLTLEIVCISEESLGMMKEGLEDYEKLYKLSAKPLHLYKIATFQYSLQRYGEATQSINALLGNQQTAQEKLYISIAQGQGQEVNLLAACWNVAGMIALETGKTDEAKTFFNKALEIDPNFLLPKNNIQFIDSKK